MFKNEMKCTMELVVQPLKKDEVEMQKEFLKKKKSWIERHCSGKVKKVRAKL